MPFWDEIRRMVVEKLGEYDDQTVAGTTGASLNNDTIYRKLEQKYRYYLRRATWRDKSKFGLRQSVTYAADSESIAITASGETPSGVANPSLRNKEILRVEDYTDTDYPSLMKRLSSEQYDAWNRERFLPDEGQWHYYIEGDYLYVLPKPSAALTLRVTYIPAITVIDDAGSNDGTTGPDLFPEEFHELLATAVAVSIHGELGRPPEGLREELHMLEREFLGWASEPRAGGVRLVTGV